MGKKDSAKAREQWILVNIMEELAPNSVRHAQQALGACPCEMCFLNACALVLNEMPPKYVTTTKGALLVTITETELGHQAQMTAAATRAVMQVMKSPRHDMPSSAGNGAGR